MALKILLAGALGTVVVLGGTAYAVLGARSKPPSFDLIGDDYSRVRREALELYPRGTPVADAVSGLKALGFQCAPSRLLVPNINAPSVQCDSAGRNYPRASRTQLTVLARNGAVSDIAVGNGTDLPEANARTPDTHSAGRPGEPTPEAGDGNKGHEGAGVHG